MAFRVLLTEPEYGYLEELGLPSFITSAIPVIFVYIISTIFLIMTWLNLDSLDQNNQPSD